MHARVSDTTLHEDVLSSLLGEIEALIPDCYCSLLLADGLMPNDGSGSVAVVGGGTSASQRIAGDPPHVESLPRPKAGPSGILPSGHGLICSTVPYARNGYRVGWSETILSLRGKLLGLLIVYCRSQRKPDQVAIERIRCMSARLACAIERKAAEATSRRQDNFDPLTGLPNRSNLAEAMKRVICSAAQMGGIATVLFLDLDHFKDINDTLGHSIGDKLLACLATRVQLAVDDNAVVSRLGGDEFVVLLPAANRAAAEIVAQRILRLVSESNQVDQYDLRVTVSIGIAIYPDHGEDFETLLQSADAAMYRAKAEGRHCYQFFQDELRIRAQRNLQLLSALRLAFDRREFSVVYQPQVSLRDGHVVGAEALLRWHSAELGPVAPAEFIPIAEESGLIAEIGEWVLRQAVRDARQWAERWAADFSLSVNLSAVQFRCPNLVERVLAITREADFPPDRLVLELTESAAMRDSDEAVAIINGLRVRGIRVAIDDFGTGYSSLSYLKRFNTFKLKIDQSFVRDLSFDPDDRAIVRALIAMARNLGMGILAEGVETAEQLAFLRDEGCEEIQGFYVSSPLPAADFSAFFGNGSRSISVTSHVLLGAFDIGGDIQLQPI